MTDGFQVGEALTGGLLGDHAAERTIQSDVQTEAEAGW
jgi:hypothetical protein